MLMPKLNTVLALQFEFVSFWEYFNNLANKVIADESKVVGMENCPQDVTGLLELMFHKPSVYKAQAATKAADVETPFQNLVNGFWGVINGVSDAVGSVLNGGKNDINITITHTNGTNTSSMNPLRDFLGGIANGIGSLFGPHRLQNIGSEEVGAL